MPECQKCQAFERMCRTFGADLCTYLKYAVSRLSRPSTAPFKDINFATELFMQRLMHILYSVQLQKPLSKVELISYSISILLLLSLSLSSSSFNAALYAQTDNRNHARSSLHGGPLSPARLRKESHVERKRDARTGVGLRSNIAFDGRKFWTYSTRTCSKLESLRNCKKVKVSLIRRDCLYNRNSALGSVLSCPR